MAPSQLPTVSRIPRMSSWISRSLDPLMHENILPWKESDKVAPDDLWETASYTRNLQETQSTG